MIREILKIRTDFGLGNNNPTFKEIELTEYSAKFSRMGMPELTATLKWPTPLDNEWTRREYVELRGERFYIRHTPSGKKDNQDARYSHEIEFTSEFAEILGNTYFEDSVPSYSATYDKPCSNSSKFTFYGTISEFCDRLNCSFLKAGIADSILYTKTSLTTLDAVAGDGYCAVVDPYGDYDPDKSYEFSFEDKKHWEAITEGYTVTEIPFERRGRRIIFGAVPHVVNRVFEYGHDNELLSISHKNANAQVINRITMIGSSENIPYFYPNETEYGHISISVRPDNKALKAGHISIINMTQFLSRLNADTYAVLGKYDGVDVGNANVEVSFYSSAFDEGDYYYYPLGVLHHKASGNGLNAKLHIRVFFTVRGKGYVEVKNILGNVWTDNNNPPTSTTDLTDRVTLERLCTVEDKSQGIESVDFTSQIEKKDGVISLGYLEAEKYYFQFSINVPNRGGGRNEPVDAWCKIAPVDISNAAQKKTGYYWKVGNAEYDVVGKLGVKINTVITDAMIGDGFGWHATGRMPFQTNLMPSKFRDTGGMERYYNAANGTYIDPDTKKPYEFPNPFIPGAPSEYIYRNEEICPTIEGMTNASGQLMGEIAEVAYDADDNDILKPDSEDGDKNDSLKYEHSFFYIKLNVFDGDYGFDLFSHASQTDPMTLQMRSGSCNGCKFKIQSAKFTDDTGLETFKNPIIVKDDVAVGAISEEGIREGSLDQTQQNTQTHSIWVCVQKDAETFGTIMPNHTNNFKPQPGDRFNIINIDLPQAYILAAEKRLEEDGIRFMADNNEEKFTFDISASRIFFAENPDVLAEIDEYSKIRVKYNGKEYEQYVNQLSIDCKDSEVLPNIGIDLTDTLAVGQSFIDTVAERAASLIATAVSFGSGGGGLSATLADKRYLNKQRADRTPYALNVGDMFTAESGAHFGDFVQGMFTGRGAAIDSAGNAEVESIRVRSSMEVMELIYNRLNAQEGNTSFSDNGTIDYVLEDPENGTYIAQMRMRWDGDFTAFQPGDVIYGYVNDLNRSDKKEYYKAWAWIKSVDRAANRITFVPYPDIETPAGVNHLLTDGMIITRWGNNVEPTLQTFINPDYSAVIGKYADGTYYNKRQRTFYISCEDGNIVELVGVNKPILERGNYGTVLGQIPDGLLDPVTAELVNKGQPYLFARGIIVQDLIRIGYEGLTTRLSNYRGAWNKNTAESDTDYYRSTTGMYDTVTHNGALWQCVVGHAMDEPSDTSSSWLKMTSSLNDAVIKLWTINPNATVVSVRPTEVTPEKLSCTVTLNSNDKPVVYSSNLELYDAGAELYYSADGVNWQIFVIGNAEPLDLEDESGYIELEDSVDDSDFLVVGGDNIDTKDIADRIYFELRSVEDGTVLASTQVPVVKDGERGAYQSTVFIRTNEKPSTPEGGTYAEPIPTSEPKWSDAIPEGEEILWASTRIFDNRYDTQWSAPRQMTDTATYDVEFSDTDENPGNPTDNPDKWYDPDADKDKVDFTQMLWRAERRKKNGIWSGWTIVRIKGENGDWVSYVFKESETAPATPTGTRIIPDGWSDAPSPTGVWWMSKATIDGGTQKAGEWSTPVKVTGEDGKDGGYTDFKYNKNNSLTEPPAIDKTSRYPDGWRDEPPSVTRDEFLWLSKAEIREDDSLKTMWSAPVRISGGNGYNGNWSSYAFKKSDTKPATPTGKSIIPDGWNDAPGGDGRWWMSKAIIDGVTEEAGAWSDPVQVTGEDGKPGQYTDFKYRAFEEEMTPATVDDTARHPAGWSDEPPFITDGFALWMIQAEIDSDNQLIGKWSKPVRISGETGKDGGEIDIWTINPNASIVSIRENETVPDILGASVILNNSLNPPIEFFSNLALYEAGAKLLFSVNGQDWNTFIMGIQEPLDLEDNSGVIELENSVDDSHILTVGGDAIPTDTIGDRIYFELRSVDNNGLLASTQVPVVRDGKAGLPGRDGLMCYPAGVFDRNKRYSAADDTMPVVQHGDEESGIYNYFRLKAGASYKGADMPSDRDTPAKDIAKNDADTVWVLFDQFDSVFANIIMANFAKLSYAVFYGEWMISQEGLLNGEPSSEYRYFKDGSFVPNFAVNFKTGEMMAGSGIFSGSLLQRFKTINNSDAVVTGTGGNQKYLLQKDLNIIASGVSILLPTDISYTGYRVAIANNVEKYTRVEQKTTIATQDGSNILGFPRPVIDNEDGTSLPRPGSGEIPISGSYNVTILEFITGVVELIAIPDENEPKCRWFITSINAYISNAY